MDYLIFLMLCVIAMIGIRITSRLWDMHLVLDKIRRQGVGK